MLSTKKPPHQFNLSSQSAKRKSTPDRIDIKRCNSQIFDPSFQQLVDLNVEAQQLFLCFQCANQLNRQNICPQCQGKGILAATHPLVQLMNDVFNAKFVPASHMHDKKNMISTKTSSNSNLSDSFINSDKPSHFNQRNSSEFRQKKQKQPSKASILDFLLTPLQTIIRQESGVDEKSKKCNICHYQFDSVKYICEECQNYNVCEQCYQTKRISHSHQLKKMESVSSQKSKRNDQNQNDRLKLEKQKQFQEHEIEFTHSDVDRLSLKSDESVQLMFNRLKTKEDKNEQNNDKEESGFFKLHQVQQKHKKKQLCNNCQNDIEDCYWICESCKNSNESYQICKECYDQQTFQHPKQHNLGLNFFTLDDSFFQPEHNFFDHIRQDSPKKQDLKQLNLQQKQRINPNGISSITLQSNSKLASTLAQPDMSNIGVIGHRDIFTGFHKQTQNEHYQNQIISPIPRSINLARSFKDKKLRNTKSIQNQSDPQSFVQFISSSIHTPKKQLKIQENDTKPLKQNFINQSRIQFDENIMMDLGLSKDENVLTPKTPKKLSKSQKRSRQNEVKYERFDNLFPNVTQQEINPQTSILYPNLQEDYQFMGYYCDICETTPIKNIKYHCLECEDYDLCEDCYKNRRIEHWHDHFRADDGRSRRRKLHQNKQKLIKRAVQNLNKSLSSSRRSLNFLM